MTEQENKAQAQTREIVENLQNLAVSIQDYTKTLEKDSDKDWGKKDATPPGKE